jgi:hypothetical protein
MQIIANLHRRKTRNAKYCKIRSLTQLLGLFTPNWAFFVRYVVVQSTVAQYKPTQRLKCRGKTVLKDGLNFYESTVLMKFCTIVTATSAVVERDNGICRMLPVLHRYIHNFVHYCSTSLKLSRLDFGEMNDILAAGCKQQLALGALRKDF